MSKLMTETEIDKHVFAHAEKLGIKNINAPLTQEQLSSINVCALYTTVRPILTAAKSLLGFFKPSWAAIVGTFMGVMDTTCQIPAGS